MEIIHEAKKIWSKMVEGASTEVWDLRSSVYNKLLSIISVGDFYYYIFNVKTTEIEFVSDDVEKILGYEKSSFNVPFILQRIHPEDVSWFIDFEDTSVDFLKSLPVDKVLKYKVRYDYRIKKADGGYIRILSQVLAIEHALNGEVIRTLGVHTDITDIKREGKPILSFVGLEGEPSFINVKPKKKFTPDTEIFTDREKEILLHLVNGKSSIQVSELLNISKVTVDTHRRNMMRKANCKKITELINRAIIWGYI